MQLDSSNRAALTPSDPPFLRRMPALDGVRGVAILAVFLYHYAAGNTLLSPVARTITAPVRLGWSGVDLFFVLSGFLITGILYDTSSNRHYYRQFYIRRTLRIFPIYYIFLVVLLSLTSVIHAKWHAAHLLFLLYLGNPAILIWPTLVAVSPMVQLTHLWSLAVEEQFYMVWPVVVRRIPKPRALLFACLSIITVAFALRVLVYSTGIVPRVTAYILLLCRMDCLAIGAALAIAVRSSIRETVLRVAPKIAVISGSAAAALFAIRNTTDRMDVAVATVGYSLLAVFYATLVAMCLAEKSWIQRFFAVRVLRFFGKISYGLYIYHFALQPLLERLKPGCISMMHSHIVGLIVHLSISLLVCVSVAWLSFKLIESPILRLKDRFSYADAPDDAVCARADFIRSQIAAAR